MFNCYKYFILFKLVKNDSNEISYNRCQIKIYDIKKEQQYNNFHYIRN